MGNPDPEILTRIYGPRSRRPQQVTENKHLLSFGKVNATLQDEMTRRWNMQTKITDWRALSEAASQEQDPEKLMQLIEELNLALLHREVEMHRRLAIN